jgi:hypothetical protein
VAGSRPRKHRRSGVNLHNSILAACHVSISAAFSTSSSLHSPDKLWAVLSVGKAWKSLAMARRLIAQALGVTRNLLKVWFFGPHLAAFEVANSNVANYLVFHGFFLAGNSEITVVHSFRQATSLEQQLHPASLEVEDESNVVQFSVPLDSSQTTIDDHHRQTTIACFSVSSTFCSSYHGSKKVLSTEDFTPTIGSLPTEIACDEDVPGERDEERCMAMTCMAVVPLPEVLAFILPPPSSKMDKFTFSPPQASNRDRSWKPLLSFAEHVQEVNFHAEKSSGFPVQESSDRGICSLPFNLLDFPPLVTSGGINGVERGSPIPSPSASSIFQKGCARSFAEVLASQPIYTPLYRGLLHPLLIDSYPLLDGAIAA